MNKLLLILLVCSSGVLAQEQEKWACGAEKVGGFAWQNSDFYLTNFTPDNVLFTLDGDKGIVEFGESIYVLDCEASEAHLYCNNGTQNFILDLETGRAGFSSLMGALIQSNSFIGLFQCSKS